MKVTTLFSELDYRIIRGTKDKDVNDLKYYSKECGEKDAFFALKGRDFDGHAYIDEAIRNGASVIILEDSGINAEDCCSRWMDSDVTFIGVKDTRKALACASNIFWNKPSNKLITIGVTGTKGKTTTTFMIKKILDDAGIKTGIIGTIHSGSDGWYKNSNNTTPESYEIFKDIRNMVNEGCKAVVMEVSSQGLKFHRVEGLFFDIALFTNISPDHIGKGEHVSFDEYFQCKKKLFYQCKTAILNCDDPLWKEVCSETSAGKIITFGINNKADFRGQQLSFVKKEGTLGIEYKCSGEKKICNVYVPLPGEFNVYNSLGAIAASAVFGVEFDKACSSLKGLTVRGRSEMIKVSDDYTVLIDYAHNGVALKNLLTTLRKYDPERLIVVFGCGGERDRSRRFDMGSIAGKYADFSVVTSDNPRNEDPGEIIKDIVSSLLSSGGSYCIIPDRREAISWSLDQAQAGDIIVIAGKGHETYQIIGKEIKHFDDREIVLKKYEIIQ